MDSASSAPNNLLSASPTRSACAHCGREMRAEAGISGFCCRGCEAVYGLLNARGLGQYYELQARDRPLRKAIPAELPGERYEYLDDPAFLSLYATPAGRERGMRFFLEGAHCAACVWLTEQLGQFVPGVERSRLDLGTSVLTVQLGTEGSFAEVARELARLGYRPLPVRADDVDGLQAKSNHRALVRVGVAGACAGNIMLLTTSLYAGAEGPLAEVFRWVSGGLSLPVLLFSAVPFYRTAWSAIRARQVSIDIPITLGIMLGAFSSLYNLCVGSPFLYFDSLTMLVFLMLASRYVLQRTQQAALNSSRLVRFLSPGRARRVIDGNVREVPVDQIVPGDLLEALPGDCLPVDGVLMTARGSFDQAWLTGESLPVEISEGEPVFAGTINLSSPIRFQAVASGGATRLGRILKSVTEDLSRKARIATFADRAAKLFVTAVLLAVGVVVIVGLRSDFAQAVNLALALSIVTCPCAFALATPLALSVSIGRCAKQGVLVKGTEVLERLSQVDSVFLDKTGTLTQGKFVVTSWTRDPAEDAELIPVLVSLESRSRHPVARAVAEYFGAAAGAQRPEVGDFCETPGRGVEGRIAGRHYEIRSAWQATAPATVLAVFREGHPVAQIRLQDQLREEADSTVRAIRDLGLPVSILSGDGASIVARVARELGLSSAWQAGQSPENKRDAVTARPRALMVGDGANDASALAAAHVGIAVHGGMEVSLRSADVYCRMPGIRAVAPLIVVARETMRVIRRNFAFSLVYNIIGIAGVVAGQVTPLFAAILMPISAATVFASSIWGTRALRKALGEMAA